MTDVTFSARFNTIAEKTHRYAIEAIETSNKRLGVILHAPEMGVKRIQPYFFGEELLARYRFVMFIREVLSDRLGSHSQGHNDIMSFVQQVKDIDTGKTLDEAELSAETAVLIVAGSERLMIPSHHSILTFDRLGYDIDGISGYSALCQPFTIVLCQSCTRSQKKV
jgi:hypothetical protein